MASGASASWEGPWPWREGMWCKCPGCPKCHKYWRYPKDPCGVLVTKRDRAYHPYSPPNCEKCRKHAIAQQLPPHADGSGSATNEVTAVLEKIQKALAKVEEQLGDIAEQVGAIAEAVRHLERLDHLDASWLQVGSD